MLRPAPGYSSSLNAFFAPPRAGEDDGRLAHLKRLQFESLANHAKRLPWMVPIACGFVGFTVWNAVPAALILGWIALIAAILSVRWEFSRRSLARADLDVDAALRTMAVFSFFNGLVMGAGAALFFADLSLEQKAIVTMIVVSICAAAVSANAGYARSFYAWALPTFASLAIAWASQGDVAGAWVGFLLLLFPFLQGVFISENERVMRESFEIRYHNERLIRELEVQRQAVARERDRAEEANRAKSRFLASASHDLRQPLHTLSLYSAALRVPGKTEERTQEMAREIGTAIASLGTLLDALLDISKLDAGAVRPEASRFALDALLARMAGDFRPIAQAKGLALALDAHAPLTVETDPVLFERILGNLIDNAIKYTAGGSVRIAAHAASDQAVITITDTGPGIPSAEHERVFEEFYQLGNRERDRSRGIGLGLAIVRRLTELLRIDLELESDLGRGTTFRLTLPCVHDRRLAVHELEVPDEAVLPEGLVALVVDDERSVREGMRTLLEAWGCRVLLASGIDEALAALAAAPPDLIIADHRLRGTETGIALVQRARGTVGEVPALLITGDTATEVLEHARQLGLTLLRKPVHEQALRSAIAEVVKTQVR
jgi:signal transduction histidine kinase/CheY-like chemotaxis protein